jgi:alpha-1,2-mannosyltransferase
MIGRTFGLRLLSQRGPQLLTLWLLAALALAFRAIQFATLTTRVQWGYDFSFYWTAALRLLHGEAIYTAAQLAGPYAPQGQDGFLYPPPLAAILMPLANLFPTDYRAAAWFWTIDGAVILAIVVLTLHSSERLAERYPILEGRGRWLLVAGAFAFPPVVGELVLGNVHLVLLGLLTLAWLEIRRQTPGGDMAAGIAVGVAAAIKVFPGVLLIWFLLTRRYRAAAGVVIGALVLTLVTLPFTGIEPWLQYPTVLLNLAGPSDTTDTLAPMVWLAPLIGFSGARIVVLAAGLMLLVGVSVAARRDLPSARTAVVARSFGAAVLISILIAPALYHHYLAITVLPFILGLAAGVRLRWLALAYFLMWGGQQAALGDLAWIVNRAAPTLGVLVLLGALLVLLRRPPPRSTGAA